MRLKTMRRKTASPQTRLIREQSGATMVMGVFIAVLLVGLIYFVWGIGDSVMRHERMQDASDTAAFGAAVLHARGMNLLALINVVMAALAMVGATLAVITNMIGFAATAATVVCAFCGPYCGSCCDACEPAANHTEEYADAADREDFTKTLIEFALDGLHGYAQGLRTGVPLAAQAKIAQYAEYYAPVTEQGFMAPPRIELPVEDDDSNWPCDEKVAPTVAASAPVLVWLYGSTSIYMVAGVAFGSATVISESRDYCDMEIFQRVTDEAQTMGNNEYQLQAYMTGDPDYAWTQRGVAVAAWGEGDNAGQRYTDLAELGQVSFAQAEFMYDDSESDWREWMWHMNWRARLRRYRLEALGDEGFGAICEESEACAPLESVTQVIGAGLDDAVVH